MNSMDKEKLTELVYINLGRASMCWSEIPRGDFDSTKVAELGKEIMDAVEKYLENQEPGVTSIPTISTITFNPPLQKEIYKVNRPVFILWTYKVDESGEKVWDNRVLTTTMRKGTLKDYIDSYPDRHIFFYEEITTEIFEGSICKIVRVASIEKEPGVVIESSSDYEKIIV